MEQSLASKGGIPAPGYGEAHLRASLCSHPSTFKSDQGCRQGAQLTSAPPCAESVGSFAETPTGLTTWLANGCRHRAGAYDFLFSLCFSSGFLSRWAGLPGPWFRADLRMLVHLRRSSVAFYLAIYRYLVGNPIVSSVPFFGCVTSSYHW